MIFTLAACGSKNSTNSAADTQSSSESTEAQTETLTKTPAETAEDPEETPAEEPEATEETMEATESGANEMAEGKILVVYYSATGTTENVAGMIADATGGELFEIEPVEPYSDEDLDWTDSDSRVNAEHENEAERDVELVSTTVDDFEDNCMDHFL